MEWMAGIRRRGLTRSFLILMLHCYQAFISPLCAMLGSRCRFFPSCSQYALDALRRHPLKKGVALSVGRVCRCYPLSPHRGYDPVP